MTREHNPGALLGHAHTSHTHIVLSNLKIKLNVFQSGGGYLRIYIYSSKMHQRVLVMSLNIQCKIKKVILISYYPVSRPHVYNMCIF